MILPIHLGNMTFPVWTSLVHCWRIYLSDFTLIWNFFLLVSICSLLPFDRLCFCIELIFSGNCEMLVTLTGIVSDKGECACVYHGLRIQNKLIALEHQCFYSCGRYPYLFLLLILVGREHSFFRRCLRCSDRTNVKKILCLFFDQRFWQHSSVLSVSLELYKYVDIGGCCGHSYVR